MNRTLLLALAAASLALSASTAFARGADDGALADTQGRNQDAILKRLDLRGHNQDVLLKREGADNRGLDLRGHNQDVLLKRGGADDPVNHIRRAARGADDVHHMEHARGHR
ncbi:MAG TPA: hypothetical protein VFP44_23015 [Usitatibacter sp.]|nr:hypothetical protein [Usitatibacter sp.]